MADLKKHGQTFIYGELSIGSNRGITIHRKGVAKDDHRYKFNPDPHNEDKWYNKNQGKFYAFAAEAIADWFNAHANTWPRNNDTVTIHNTDYQLELQ